jgi:hypothetical protein
MAYDQSFCINTLERVLQKRDFRKIPANLQKDYRDQLLTNAELVANSIFNLRTPSLKTFTLKGKEIYSFSEKADELVARKICENLKRSKKTATSGRLQIVSHLRLLLEEGIPYRVYRLDVRNFYESFDRAHITAVAENLQTLSPQSKQLLRAILDHHGSIGGLGIPRGLSLSAELSDLMMERFDMEVKSNSDVFYYARYVDDIIVITSCRENRNSFVSWIESSLPKGLTLNREKTQVVESIEKVSPTKLTEKEVRLFSFDYLGYSFTVNQPIKNSKSSDVHFRKVIVDISIKKIKKIKTRIVRSMLSFGETGDWMLLRDRIKFLTQNYSVYNAKIGDKKLAGIFHS